MKRALGSLAFTVMLSVIVPTLAGPGNGVLGQASFNTSLQTTDFSGEWTEIPHEIGFTAELYDYSGLPVNAAGRMRYDTGDISEWSIPEFVCRPHPGVSQIPSSKSQRWGLGFGFWVLGFSTGRLHR
jgi:hypothetical protein